MKLTKQSIKEERDRRLTAGDKKEVAAPAAGLGCPGVQKDKKKIAKSYQHVDFPSGPPPQY